MITFKGNYINKALLMEAYVPLIVQLASGALGGYVAGKLLKNMSLGKWGNLLLGIVGGGLGGQLLGMLNPEVGIEIFNMPAIIGGMASGAVGGGALMALVGMLKKVISK